MKNKLIRLHLSKRLIQNKIFGLLLLLHYEVFHLIFGIYFNLNIMW